MWKVYAVGAGTILAGGGLLYALSGKFRELVSNALEAAGLAASGANVAATALQQAGQAAQETVAGAAAAAQNLANDIMGIPNTTYSPMPDPHMAEWVTQMKEKVFNLRATESDWNAIDVFDRRMGENIALEGKSGMSPATESSFRMITAWRPWYQTQGIAH